MLTTLFFLHSNFEVCENIAFWEATRNIRSLQRNRKIWNNFKRIRSMGYLKLKTNIFVSVPLSFEYPVTKILWFRKQNLFKRTQNSEIGSIQ